MQLALVSQTITMRPLRRPGRQCMVVRPHAQLPLFLVNGRRSTICNQLSAVSARTKDMQHADCEFLKSACVERLSDPIFPKTLSQQNGSRMVSLRVV